VGAWELVTYTSGIYIHRRFPKDHVMGTLELSPNKG
jgi:hypothetical protein